MVRAPKERTTIPGVYRCGERFVAVLTLPGRRQLSRTFDTIEQAAEFKATAAPARDRRHAPPMIGQVYFAQRRSGGPLKIGFTAGEVDDRLAQLEAEFRCGPLRAVATLPAVARDERLLHSYFADRRLDGEWFDVTLDDVEHGVEHLRFLLGGSKKVTSS